MILLITVMMVSAAAIGRTLPRQNITFVSARDTTSQLYLMDFGRGLSHKLSNQPVIACCPVWSPDGARLAFPSLDDGAAKIFVMDWDGSNLRRLTANRSTNEGSPVWSPNSEQIAFVFVSLLSGKAAIYITNADGSGLHALTSHLSNLYDYAPVWSPDGRKILFVSDLSLDGESRLDDAELFTVNPDGSARAQLTDDDAYDSAAAYSPDGSRIVFTTTPPDYFPIAIYRMDADGRHHALISDQDIARNTAPAWSPDGSRILFLSHRDGDVEFYAVDAGGKNLRKLTDNAAPDWLPTWSPDGSRILFLSARDGDSAVYLMDADGANAHRLTPFPASDTFAAWQP